MKLPSHASFARVVAGAIEAGNAITPRERCGPAGPLDCAAKAKEVRS